MQACGLTRARLTRVPLFLRSGGSTGGGGGAAGGAATSIEMMLHGIATWVPFQLDRFPPLHHHLYSPASYIQSLGSLPLDARRIGSDT